jgi:hypothetical protein
VLILLRTLTGIVLLRLGPDALPRSAFLTGVLFAVMIAVSFLGLALSGGWQPWSPVFFALSLGLSLGSYMIALRLRGFGGRILQTFAALFGASALLGVAELPLLATGTLESEAQGGAIVLLGLIAWSILVDGHILARALEVPLIAGTLLALAVFGAQLVLYQQFPSA